MSDLMIIGGALLAAVICVGIGVAVLATSAFALMRRARVLELHSVLESADALERQITRLGALSSELELVAARIAGALGRIALDVERLGAAVAEVGAGVGVITTAFRSLRPRAR